MEAMQDCGIGCIYSRPKKMFTMPTTEIYRPFRVIVSEQSGPYLNDGILELYVAGGSGEIIINGMGFPLRAGCLVTLHSYHVFSIVPQADSRLELSCHLIDYKLLSYLAVNGKIADDYFELKPVMQLSAAESAIVSRTIEELIGIYESFSGGLADYMILFGVLDQFYTVAKKYQYTHNDDFEMPVGWRLMVYITKYSSQRLTPSKVAAHFGLDAVTVNRELRRISTYNFGRFLSRARTNDVCSSMAFQDVSQAYLAQYCGFESENAFFRAFKANTGISPKAYKERIRSSVPGLIFSAANEKALSLLNYIMMFYRQPITTQTAAETLYLTTSNVNEILMSNFGMTFHAFVACFRLEYAKMLLLTTDMAVCDISEESGFGSLSSFCRHFKASCGMTAQKYRKEQHDEN